MSTSSESVRANWPILPPLITQNEPRAAQVPAGTGDGAGPAGGSQPLSAELPTSSHPTSLQRQLTGCEAYRVHDGISNQSEHKVDGTAWRPTAPAPRSAPAPPATTPTALVGEVLFGPPRRCCHAPPAGQWLAGQKQVADALPPVLVILPPGLSRLRRKGRPGVSQQLGGRFVEANHRPLRVVWFGVQIQDILHVGHEVGAHLGNAPLFLLPRFEGVFFRCRRTVSWERDSTTPNSTIRSAIRRRFQWPWPSGAGLEAKTIGWASPRASSLRYRWGWVRSSIAPDKPTLGETPLDPAHRALGHIQRLTHPARGPAVTITNVEERPGVDPPCARTGPRRS